MKSIYPVLMRIRHLNHSTYQTQYHIVWCTKYCRKIIKPYVQKEIVRSILKTLNSYPTWFMHQLNTGPQHIHLRIELPPNVAVSTVVRELKSRSSIHLRSKFKYIDKIYEKSGIWSVGYFVSTIGLNELMIKKYITNQEGYDVGYDVTDEYSC